MLQKRHFLGWNGPVVEKVGDWLLAEMRGPRPVDLRDTLIVVPTLQAGRRLRETLALRCHEQGSALLSAAIVTPHFLFSRRRNGAEAAAPALTKAVWTEVLQTADLSKFSALFPRPQSAEEPERFRWALATGEIIERLRQELADGGYRTADVIEKCGSRIQELERWNDLARIEKLYLQRLVELGFSDSCDAKIGAADDPQIGDEIARVVAACVPDPSLLAVRALQKLAGVGSVDILVHAPETMAGRFDEWGRPVAAEWVKEIVDIPDWENNVFLEASPDSQAARVIGILSGLPGKYGPSDIGIGVPDPAVIPFLEKELRAIRLPAFDPADAPFMEHALGRLVGCISDILFSRSYAHVAGLFRHPDFLHYLKASRGIGSRSLLTQLDEFQNRRLPVTLDDMLAHFAGGSGGFPALEEALCVVRRHVEAFESGPLEEALRLLLQSVYGGRDLNDDNVEDKQFRRAAEIMEKTFRESAQIPETKLGLEKGRLQNIFFRRLREQKFSRERGDAVLDLQGWLELHWTDTPVLVVTGLNEECVPGGSLSDVFLPDSLRKMLDLRDDISRFGRDAYLLKALVESRRDTGRLCVIVGKRALSGDPLRPSRLLFRCRDEDLPARAERLFRPVEQAGRIAASETIFRLRPAAAEQDEKVLGDKAVSVTALRDYLVCPFLFYLKHVLKMEALSDDKNELDALDFGSVVHEVLQVMGGDEKLRACRDAEVLGGKLAGIADCVAAARFGKVIPPAATVALASAKARLMALAVKQAALTAEGWEIAATEQKASLARKGFTINGKIDRIDRNKHSGATRIIDYKTSDKSDSPEARHLGRRREGAADYNRLIFQGGAGQKGHAGKSEKQWLDLQLPLYRMLYRDNMDPGAAVELAYFNLPKAVGETDLTAWRAFNDEMMKSAARCLDGVLDCISKRLFWPPTPGARYDEDFRTLFADSPENACDVVGFPA